MSFSCYNCHKPNARLKKTYDFGNFVFCSDSCSSSYTATHFINSDTIIEEPSGRIVKVKPISLYEMLVGKEDVGSATWVFTHTTFGNIAEKYPDTIPDDVKRFVLDLLNAIANLYPCDVCGAHFKTMYAENPADLSSGTNLAIWWCKIHNIVNARLGKPLWPCTFSESVSSSISHTETQRNSCLCCRYTCKE